MVTPSSADLRKIYATNAPKFSAFTFIYPPFRIQALLVNQTSSASSAGTLHQKHNCREIYLTRILPQVLQPFLPLPLILLRKQNIF